MDKQMSYSIADRDALKAAIARGATRLRMGNEEVQYRSLAEMERILAKIEAELAPVAPSRRHYPAMTRGT
jgi:hypothetical protein